MKKILALTTLLLIAVLGVNAQVRKSWDFTKGFSDVTKTNLKADVSKWATNSTDGTTGEILSWKDAVKMSGTLKANGIAIAELYGLTFGTAGLSSSTNYLLNPTAVRMTRAGMIVNLPKLAAGQKITIMAKSANSTDARGITANNTNVTKLQGPDNDKAPGSEGLQTSGC